MPEPARRPDVIELAVDDELLVYDPVAERIHVLNATAAVIWQLLDGSSDLAGVAADLQDAFPDAPDDVLTTVVEPTVATFDENALLGAAAVSTAVDDGPAPNVDLGEHPRESSADDVTSPTYDALGHRFDLTGPAVLVEEVAWLLDSLRSDVAPEHHYALRPDGRIDDHEALVMSLDGCDLRRVERQAVMNCLVADINERAVYAGGTRSLVFHAGVVATSAGAMLLAGKPNAGKSTLVAGLLAAGLGYLTDEAAPVDMTTLDVAAYPKPIALDRGSWELFARLGPPLVDPEVHQRWWLRPDQLGPVPPFATLDRLPLIAVVIIQHDDAGPTASERLTSTAAIVTDLVPHLFNLAEHGSAGLEALVRLAEAVPCHRLRHDSLQGGVGWFLDTLGR